MSKILGLILTFISLFLGSCSDKFWGCGQKVNSNIPSPNGEYQIVFYSRDCGATTIPLGVVAIVSQEKFEGLDLNGYDIRRRDVIFTYERTRVRADWVSDNEVKIDYHFDTKYYGREGFASEKRQNVGDVKIIFNAQ